MKKKPAVAAGFFVGDANTTLIPVAADSRSEAAIGCEAVAKSDTWFYQIAPGLRFYGRFAASLRSSAATGKQLSRVHIRHLHLTELLVSPLRRVTTEPALGLSGGGSCDRHISSVGAGLARDAGTSFCLDDRRAGIAGKPAPTRDWWCLCSHAIVQTIRMPLTEGRPAGLLASVRAAQFL